MCVGFNLDSHANVGRRARLCTCGRINAMIIISLFSFR